MPVEPLNPKWQVALQNSIKQLSELYRHNKGFILTEGDLECQLFSILKNTPVFNRYKDTKTEGWKSGFIHSQVTWFEVAEERGFEVDITICDPANLEIEHFEFVQDYPNKGFFHDGPCIAVELKFIRTEIPFEIKSKAKEDYEHVINKLRLAKEENIEIHYVNADMTNVDFVVLVVCKTKQIFDIAKIELDQAITNCPCPENVFPILFCQEDRHFYNRARYFFD